MASIVKIEIEGFKAFPKYFYIDLPEGKNLLMYGENGSGKSSIYYALHALLQSVFKTDHGAKYFTHSDEENLINIYRINDVIAGNFNPNVKLTFNDGDVWTLNLNGVLASTEDKIKLLNRYAIFINHSYISRFHAARNSEEIDLWNVFYKDILPFYLPAGRAQFLADTYDDIVKKSQSMPMPRLSNHRYLRKISDFNSDLEGFINQINNKVSDIYNTHFKNIDDNDLDIKLCFFADNAPNNTNHEEHYLFYGNNRFGHPIAKGLYNPNIGISIKENNTEIYKPQTYFNEAKLTAIALSVRFACLSQHPVDGAFLALDDMLISLDMSNRTKVVDYLLKEVIGKYKIYLFTHDKSLYAFIDYKIKQYKQHNNWLRKELFVGKDSTHKENPIIIDGEIEPIDKARKYFGARDYEVASLYIRKAVEKLIVELLPRVLYQKTEGGFVDLQTLWKKLITFYSNNQTNIEPNIIKLFEDSKLLVLNPSAHYQRLATPIYKNEIESALLLFEELSKLPKLEKKFVIPKGTAAEFNYPQKNYSCRFEFDNDLTIIEGDNLISVMPKCKNIYWVYNGIDYYDFETGVQNLNHPLKTATPKLNKFMEGITQKIPLGITEEQFMENCNIDGISMNDYFGGVKISSLILASTKA